MQFKSISAYRREIIKKSRMRSRSKHFCLIIATLLLSLASPLLAITSNFKPSRVQAQTVQDPKAEAARLIQLAWDTYYSDEKQSLEYLQQALKIYTAIGDKVGTAETFHAMGEFYRNQVMLNFKEPSPDEKLQIQAQYLQIKEFFEQAVALYRELGDSTNGSNYNFRTAQAIILQELGDIYRKLGQYSQALEAYQQALAIRSTIANVPDSDRLAASIYESSLLRDMGEMYQRLGEYPQALEFYLQTLALCQQLGKDCLNPPEQFPSDGFTDFLNDIGEVYFNLGQYSQALEFFQQAIAGFEDYDLEGDSVVGLEAFSNIGRVYARLGQSSQALVFFEKASQKYCGGYGAGDSPDATLIDALRDDAVEIEWQNADLGRCVMARGLAFGNKAEIYRQRGQYEQALQSYQGALENFTKFGDRFNQAVTLNNIGVVYKSQGQYDQALKSYQQALTIRREIKDRAGEATNLNNIGEIYRNQGQYPKALQQYQQALAIFNDIDNNTGKGATLHNLGVVYNELGQYSQALEFYQQALAIRREINDLAGEGITLNNIGLVYERLNQYAQGLDFYQKALVTHTEAKNRSGEGTALNNIGLIYDKLGQPSQGLKFLKQALKIFQDLGDQARIGNTLDSMGTLYKSLEQYSQSLESYQASLVVLREIGNRPLERITLSNLGSLYEKQQQPELAIVFYKQSVNLTETIREELQPLPREQQESYSQIVADTYRSLADLLLSQGRILEAQQVLELLKVQELRNFTKDTRAGGEETTGITTNPTETEILKIHGTLIALGQKIEECQQCAERSKLLDQREVVAKKFEQTVRSLEQEIRDRVAKDDTFVDPRKLGGNAEAIVSEPGTVLIYPLVLENKVWILWASKGGITQSIEVPKVGLKQLSTTVVKFRQLLQNPSSDITELKATGKQLYDWLFPQSLQKELQDNKIQNLVFSLDRVTRYIPMSAVFDGEKYLLENYNISTIISANLTQTGDRLPPGTQNTSVLAVGLSEAKKGFNPLPNVPAELDAIVRQSSTDSQGIYPGLQLLNQSFNRKALRDNLASHLILHIATHGKFVPNNAYGSYLLLGDGEELPIPEIQELRDLNKIHLVVLSACETALGETGQDGTEITGLSYYFLEKGAKAVMASLWQVHDKSTRLLMEQFYSNLGKSTTEFPITKAQALRQAQLSLMRGSHPSTTNTDSRSLTVEARSGVQTAASTAPGFSHPYYWAPFILVGNGL